MYGYFTIQNNGTMKIVDFMHAQAAETRCSFLRPGTRLAHHHLQQPCIIGVFRLPNPTHPSHYAGTHAHPASNFIVVVVVICLFVPFVFFVSLIFHSLSVSTTWALVSLWHTLPYIPYGEGGHALKVQSMIEAVCNHIDAYVCLS